MTLSGWLTESLQTLSQPILSGHYHGHSYGNGHCQDKCKRKCKCECVSYLQQGFLAGRPPASSSGIAYRHPPLELSVLRQCLSAPVSWAWHGLNRCSFSSFRLPLTDCLRDVLNRHITTCGQAVGGARVEARSVNRACDPCRERKVKCDSELPCARCAAATLNCVYSLRRERRESTARTASSMLNPSPMSQQRSPRTDISQATEQSAEVEGDEPFPPPSIDQADTIHVAGNRYPAVGENNTPVSYLHNPPNALVPGGYALAAGSDEAWMNVDALWNADNAAFDLFQAFSWTTTAQDPMPQSSTVFGLGGNPVDGMPTPTHSGPREMQPAAAGEQLALHPLLVASGLGLVQLDPLEHHRSRITAYLDAECPNVPQILALFRSQSVGMIINTYFRRHHRHTPIIHLPTWNIASCSTALVLAMSLITASYTPALGLRSSHIRPLLGSAYNFVIENDNVRTDWHVRDGGWLT